MLIRKMAMGGLAFWVVILLGMAASVEAAPDLVLTSLTGPKMILIGPSTVYPVVVYAKNQGTTNAGPFRIRLYFSTDSTITTSDILIPWYFDWPGLGPGAEQGFSSPNTTLPSISAGTYYLGAIIDDNNQVAENNENNNTRVADTGPVIIASSTGPEAITAPDTPLGAASTNAWISREYVSGGVVTSKGHPFQLNFDWGDGTSSGWLASGVTIASKAWSAGGTYPVKAQARCATDTTVVSGWSGVLNVTVNGPACSYSISPTSNTVGAGGGPGSVAVTAGAGCAWTASTNASSWDWVGISSGGSGSGNGTVNYNVSPNNTASQRTGTLTIAGQTFTITQQAGGACSYSITPTSTTAGAGGGPGSVAVTAGAGCAWTASTNASSWDWVGISSGGSGSGNGTVNYNVLPNNTVSQRTGTLTIASQTFTITQQAGGGCVYSISPTSNSFAKAGGTGSVAVTAGAGCAWTASTNPGSWDWVGITSGASGSGNGTVNYNVLANNTASTRTGTVTIAGQTFTITQTGLASKVVFVTSVSGNANLGSWPDAAGQTGVAAGDAICQARAAAGGLANPSQFRAWLSDQNSDAYCRIHNLTGKKSTNCGQAALPVAAGPWVRIDGFPFADTIDQLLSPNNEVFTPVRFNEFGSQPGSGSSWYYFTDTFATGTVHLPMDAGEACSNWTSTSGTLTGGSSTLTSGLWSWAVNFQCAEANHLLCLQTGTGPALPNFVSNGKKAFVTSVTGNGNLGGWPDAGGNTGIAAGDAICRARATAAGLANATHFKALLSDGATNAKDRLVTDGPWVRLDGVVVANNRADLFDGSIFTSINLNETMNYVSNWYYAWTGTAADGNKAADHCSNWTSSSSGTSGKDGIVPIANLYWLSNSSVPCNASRYLYCVED